MTVATAGRRVAAPAGADPDRWLLCRAGPQVCAVRLRFVIEVMRPGAVRPLAATPPFVRGVCVSRGTVVPVVDLSVLLGQSAASSLARLVCVRAADGPVAPDGRYGAYEAGPVVALGVDEVMGLASIAAAVFADLPPLLDGVRSGGVAALGVADGWSLAAVDTARVFPEELWERVRQAYV